VPAKRVPELVTQITRLYKQDRQQDETFNQYLKRVGMAPITKLVEEFSQIPDLNGHTQEMYMDWEKTVAYKVERGEGECSV
jgi:hypothetical protein